MEYAQSLKIGKGKHTNKAFTTTNHGNNGELTDLALAEATLGSPVARQPAFTS